YFDFPFTLSIPINPNLFPLGFATFKPSRKLGQRWAFETGATGLAEAWLWGGSKQIGIQTQRRDQGHLQALAESQKLQHRIRAIGQKNQGSTRRPARDLQDDLLGPIRQFFGLAASLFIITRGR